MRDLKAIQFKEQAAAQREKIKTLKVVESESQDAPADKPSKLSESALKAMSEKSQKPKSKKGVKKPAWAVTEKMQAVEKEDEVDQLLEFAYELDYEKYMEDFEVRQALAVIKDRVNQIK